LRPDTVTINEVPDVPTVSTTQSRCGTGAIVLTATAPTGSAVWFRGLTTTTALTTATTSTVTYTTSSTSAGDSTYYVASKSTAGCFSARTAVLAQIIALPIAPAGIGDSSCAAGSVTLGATAGAGETIDWYSAATGGILLRSGSATIDTNLTTVSITLYAASRNTTTDCSSSTRRAVVAKYNALPTAVTAAVSASRCGAASVSLSATAPSGTTLSWFADSSTAGTVLATGPTFTTPVLSVTTRYFIASKSTSGCYSAALRPDTVTINAVPSVPTVNTTQSRCGTGSIVLTATAPTGSAVWFRSATTTTALTTATTSTVTYTTLSTSAGDSTYYVASKSTAGCFSARTAVLAHINALPAAPATTPGSVCGSGSGRFTATAIAGTTIDWYSLSALGVLLKPGSTTYDSIATITTTSSTRTLYAAARNSTTQCVSATRGTATVTWYPLLAAPTSIVGATTNICTKVAAVGDTSYYSIAAVTGATTYLWTLPTGARFDTAVTNGLKIKVTYDFATTNDSITVQAIGTVGGCAGAKAVRKLVTTGCFNVPIASSRAAETMDVKVFPNPTTTNFKLRVNTSSNEKMQVRIIDLIGNEFMGMKMMPGETLTFGSEMKSGSYLIEVRQGSKTKITRAIKL